MQPFILQKHLKFPTACQSGLLKLQPLFRCEWSETSEILLTSFTLASADFAGAFKPPKYNC